MPIHVRSRRSAPPLPFGLPAPPPGWPQKPPGISLCMIVRNEERFLPQCLRSAYDAVDEIIVVDTGSIDRTIEIAKSFGATVIEREWRNDFAWARNESIAQATKRWILFMDADEELTPPSRNHLEQLKSAPAHHTGLWVRIYNRADDYRGTGEMSHVLVRVFPNDAAIRFRGLIHEFPTLDDDPKGLSGKPSSIGIIHHGYVKEIIDERDKGTRNLAIVRAATEKEPNEPFHWFNLGTTSFLVGDYEASRDALERMLEIVGDQRRGFVPNGLAVLSEIYSDKLGDPVKAEAAARRALQLAPHYANADFQLGKSLVAQRRFDEARVAYEAAIEDGNHAGEQFVLDDQVYVWKAHSEIGSSYVIEKKDEKALEWFEKGLLNAPRAEPLIINRAKALERLGRLDAALAGFRNAYETHRSEQSAIEYINYLLRHQHAADALAVIEEAYRSLSPEKAVMMLRAAAAVSQREQSLDDERYLRAAAAIMPGSAEVLDPLEALLRARGKESEIPALVAAEEAVAPRTPADYLRRARRAIVQQRIGEAAVLAERGLDLKGDDAWLRHAAATICVQRGELERAVEHLGHVREGTLEAAIAVELLRATIYRNLGRLDAALAATGRLLVQAPEHVDALLLRAKLLEAQGDALACEETLTRAFANDRRKAAVELAGFYLRNGRHREAVSVADAALGS